MGENSAYYNSINYNHRQKINELKKQLPYHTHGFIDECLLKHRESTAHGYTQDIFFFYRYLKDVNPICASLEIKDISIDIIKQIGPQDINEYQNYIAFGHNLKGNDAGKPVSARTIARKMAALRNYFKYLINNDYLDINPTLKAVSKKREKDKKDIRRLDATQVKTLTETVSNTQSTNKHSKVLSEKTAKRDLAIVTLLLNTGIRVSECAGIDLEDVDFNENTITIVRKGGFQDHLYINEVVRNTLNDYIKNERDDLLEGENEPALFISLKHRRLSVRSIQYMIEKYGKNSKLSEKLTPHKLRRTYGTALYNKTGDIYMVADVLGHKDVNTTVKHYAAIEEEHKQRASQIDIYDTDSDQ